ncbi:MAG: MFS transporter [Ilumatobacteraceae bacterium]|jgi:MFS family permease
MPDESRDGSRAASPSALEVLRSPSVAKFIVANTLLYVGLMLQVATLGKHVYDISRRELDLGWLGLAEFLPIALLVFVVGAVADRFNRKTVSILAMGGELASSLLLVAYARTNPTSVVPIFGIALLYGASRAFVSPAMRAIGPAIAPEGGLPRMVAMYSAVWTGAMIVGPAASGFLYAAAPWISYATSAGLIAGAMCVLATLRVPTAVTDAARAERPTLDAALEGLRFIRRTPILLAAISLDLFAVLFGGAIALLPVIATERLGVGDVAYGWLRAAAGIGAASTAALLAVRPLRHRVGRRLLWAVAIFGAGTIVLGLTRTYWVAFLAVVVVHSADMVSVFVRGSVVPLVTPDDKRGRVSAVENVFIGATNELGAFQSGVTAQLVGVPATVVGGGIATLGVVAVWWRKFTALRDVDNFDELEPTRLRD